MKYTILSLNKLDNDYLDSVYTGPDGKDYLTLNGRTYESVWRFFNWVLCRIY